MRLPVDIVVDLAVHAGISHQTVNMNLDFAVRTIGLSFLVNKRKFTSVAIFNRLRSLFLRSTTLFFNESHASTKYDLKLGNFFIFNSVIKIPFSLFKSRKGEEKELKSSVCMDTTKNVSEKFCKTPSVCQLVSKLQRKSVK